MKGFWFWYEHFYNAYCVFARWRRSSRDGGVGGNMKSSIHGDQRINPDDVGNPLSFPLCNSVSIVLRFLNSGELKIKINGSFLPAFPRGLSAAGAELQRAEAESRWARRCQI